MENRLREIIISITNRCNLRCKMCQIPLACNEEMTTEELKKLISDAFGLYPNSIIFSGGEPLVRGDIFELIAFVNQHKINTCLTSNGTLIDEETAKSLASSHVGVVNISVEGPEEIHDYLRGKGNFKKAINALQNLSRYKIETTLATMVCRENYRYLPFIMNLANQHKVTTVKFQPFNEIFLLEKERKKDFLASDKDFGEINYSFEEAIALSKQYKITISPVRYLDNISRYLCGLPLTATNNYCLALRRSCPITPEGNVFLCWVLSDKVIGNVRENPLTSIWNSAYHNQLREKAGAKACGGCLMSCYDYNFGEDRQPKQIFTKAKKLRNPIFLRSKYFRTHQYLKYIFGKVSNHIFNLNISNTKRESGLVKKLLEINQAKNKLKNELKAL